MSRIWWGMMYAASVDALCDELSWSEVVVYSESNLKGLRIKYV